MTGERLDCECDCCAPDDPLRELCEQRIVACDQGDTWLPGAAER